MAPSGVGFMRPGYWGQFGGRITNESANAQELLVLNAFTQRGNQQFGQKVWVPAQSTRIVQTLTFMDETVVSQAKRGVETQSMLVHASADGEAERNWLSRHPGQALVERDRVVAMLGVAGDDVYDVIGKMRENANAGKGVRAIRQDAMPQTPEAWQSLDLLVLVASPDLSSLELDALRSWLFSGGKAWIMLDRVSDDFLASLLGDAWQVARLDETALSRVVFGHTRQAGDSYDQPVKFIRTLPQGVQVIHTLGDWPATMQLGVGQGEVIITTLEARAWMTPQANSKLDDLGEILLRRKPALEFLPETSAAMAAQSIGRQIVDRSVVMTVLASLAVAILLVGLLLHHKGRLEWMGVLAPVMALIAAVILLGVGRSKQGQVPLTLASMQLVEVSPDQHMAQSTGTVAVYSPTTTQGPLQALAGGSFIPDMIGLEGKVIRFIQTDYDQWQWQNVEFSSGAIRAGRFSQVAKLHEPVSVTGRLGPEGVWLDVAFGAMGLPEDALLVSRHGAMGTTATPSPESDDAQGETKTGRYLASSEMSLAPGQYIYSAGSVVSDLQQRRQAYFARTFNYASLPARPQYMAWTQQWPVGLTLPEEYEARPAALLSIPIHWEPAKAGTQVRIPSLLLPYTLVRPPGDASAAVIFNPATGEWISPLRDGTRLGIAFEVPEAALPLQPERIELILNLRAPGRTIDIMSFDKPRGPAVASVANPAGIVRLDVSSLGKTLDRQNNKVQLVIQIGDHPANQDWSFYGLSLEMSGQVLSSSSASSASAANASNR